MEKTFPRSIKKAQHASYAKINLFLEVLGKLPENYHEIETLLCSVSLCDTLKYVLTKRPGIEIWSNLLGMAAKSNLVFKVAQYLLDKFQPNSGVDIHLEKRIPIAAGLGGGSSNAAVTLRTLNVLWDLKLSLDDLKHIAAQFGSDIPYFLHGGTAWGTHRGEVIEQRPDIQLQLLLVNPGIGISSAEAYALLPANTNRDRKRLDRTDGYDWLFNRLEPGIRQAYPVVDRLLNDLSNAGANAAIMSGSGSTCFGVFEDAAKMAACQRNFNRIGYWTQIVRTISRKEYESEFKA
ncbi:MAG TPA: 4-(cytidine 5'-diphospho)-2-C-methyl-D-erythritol kinase [Candidatus Syntrophosphaera sp.]|nr:4-(cytidine 5'-diphospho)-2-C-methyl-D-erythritol kinase [Candidatus Cloacimonadota bacterium]HNU54673.1 4-(cytidine 5'-diphospho)-2-C-methyl-D-erythritol kinase [Candidatus Syntrophosphaera sp.]HQC47453.1 4-(cytidine 5'-diphospho)-2-C-methyl-D-erythritol kinase [Candidatus Syntrophosphaera sp.]